MSSTHFTPALTTVIGVLASVVRSADSSNVSDAAAVHAAEAAGREDADAGERGQVGGRGDRRGTARARAPDDRQVAHARLREVLLGDAAQALVVEPDARRPVEHRDRRGRHPASRRMLSNSRAASRLRGRGRPCEMIVDSSATTGAPRSRAAETCSERTSAGMRSS